MSAHIINGKELAKHREALLRNKVARFIKLKRRRPALLAIELSDDPGSKLYLKLKQAAAKRIGIEMKIIRHSDPDLGSWGRISEILRFAQDDGEFDAVFIQHPPGYDKQKWQKLADQIPPEKDVDCLTTENLQLVKQGKPRFLPATVKAVVYVILSVAKDPVESSSRRDSSVAMLPQNDSLLRFFLQNKKVVILGRSPILGLPLYWHLKNLDADVALLHSQSTVNDLRLAISETDVIISSVGKPKIITGDMVKNGVIAIDCGSPVGDMDFDSVSQRSAAITPVPGGVGPLTVVSLMENVIKSAYRASRESSAYVK